MGLNHGMLGKELTRTWPVDLKELRAERRFPVLFHLGVMRGCDSRLRGFVLPRASILNASYHAFARSRGASFAQFRQDPAHRKERELRGREYVCRCSRLFQAVPRLIGQREDCQGVTYVEEEIVIACICQYHHRLLRRWRWPRRNYGCD